MAKIHGKNADFTVNSVSLEEDGNSITLDIAIDTAEITSFGDTYKEYVEGIAGWTISADFFWNGASAKNDATLFALIGGGAVTVDFYPEGNTSTKIKYSGSAILTAMSPTAPIGGAVTMSASFQGTGTLSRSTVS